jgi:hypothetical protein
VDRIIDATKKHVSKTHSDKLLAEFSRYCMHHAVNHHVRPDHICYNPDSRLERFIKYLKHQGVDWIMDDAKIREIPKMVRDAENSVHPAGNF